MADVIHERCMDIALILILIAAYIGIYIYGKWQYSRGYHDGCSRRRKIKRQNRRKNNDMYRLKFK